MVDTRDRARIGILIPTLNEAENIPTLLHELAQVLEETPHVEKILIVDDESTDGTPQVAKETAEKLGLPLEVVVRHGERGLASAVITGARYLRERGITHVLVLDADLQHDPKCIPRLVRALVESNETPHIVIGSRYVEGAKIIGWSWTRKLISRISTWIVNTFLLPKNMKIRDPLSGMFLIEVDTLLRFARPRRGYKILLEAILNAIESGHIPKIVEVPIIFRERLRGKSKLGARTMLDFAKQVLEHFLKQHLRKILKFGIVGACGLGVNLAVLYVLTSFFLVDPRIAGAVSIEASTLSNFALHDTWTFRNEKVMEKSLIRRLAKFHLAVGASLVATYVTYLALLLAVPSPLTAMVIAVLVGTLVRYLLSIKYVWMLY